MLHRLVYALLVSQQEEVGVAVRTFQNSSIEDNIGSLYGSSVVRFVIHLASLENINWISVWEGYLLQVSCISLLAWTLFCVCVCILSVVRFSSLTS